MASPENTFDLRRDDAAASPGDPDLGTTGSPIESELPFQLLRRELRWFYLRMGGRVPAVTDAPPRVVVAASRVAGWLSEVLPMHRGAFFVRYDGRRWPVRLVRKFGALTSIVVRFAVMEREWPSTQTMAEIEQAVLAELLADIAAAAQPADLTPRGALAAKKARKLKRLQRAAKQYLREAERAYFEVRGGAPCAVPSSKEGA